MKAEQYDDEQQEELEDDSVAADLNAAFDAAESAADDTGADTGGEGETDSTPEPEPEPLAAEKASEPATDTKVTDNKEPEGKIPASLTPALREVFKKAPKELQDWATKRETEFSVGLQKNAEWAQRAQDMDRVLQPYMPYIQMSGGASIIPQVLSTAMALSMGPTATKVRTAAQLIMDSEIPLEELDRELTAMLGGEARQQQAPMSDNERWLAQFREEQEGRRQWESQQQHQQVLSGVEAFVNNPKNEFANDVREDMADILDMAAKRNISMSLEQAYDRACKMRDDIQKVVRSRNNREEVRQRRNASSSIHGSPGGSQMSDSGDDLRKSLEAAFDSYGQI